MTMTQNMQKRNNAGLAHVWAHRAKPRGDGSNFFFRGDTIYSFGNHFECGKLVTRKDQTVALITTNRWSGYTGRHISCAHRAVSGLYPIFYVPLYSSRDDTPQTPRGWFDSYQSRVLDSMKQAKTSRLYKQQNIERAQELVNEANRFAEFFGLKQRLEMPANVDEAVAEAKRLDDAAKRRESARLTRERKAREAREAKALAEAMADSVEWQAGQKDYIRNCSLLPTVLLRLTKDGKAVETSLHAMVPVAHAHRAYKIGVRLRERHETYRRNGHTIRVGHYAVDSMDEAGHIQIGCHNIEWAEVERLAKLAGWDKTEPTPEAEADAA